MSEKVQKEGRSVKETAAVAMEYFGDKFRGIGESAVSLISVSSEWEEYLRKKNRDK